MAINRRIYVSLPADPWLPPNLNALKWGIVDEIEKLGYIPEIFTNPRGKRTLAAPKAWNPRDADEIARRCVGAAVLGMPRWTFQDQDGQPALLPTEFNHYEGALARTLGLPTLVLVQKNVRRRVVFDWSFGGYVGEFDPSSDVAWLHTDEFRVPFGYWNGLLNERSDVFLGYSSKSSATATAVKRFLQSLGAKVLDVDNFSRYKSDRSELKGANGQTALKAVRRGTGSGRQQNLLSSLEAVPGRD